jgi:anti-anti-sigma factor
VTASDTEARVRYLAPVSIIDLRGQLTAQADEPLQRAYAEAAGHRPEAVLLNLGAVDYINSIGIALIVKLISRERPAGRRLLACVLNEHYTQILRLSRLTDFISLFADEPGALAAIAAS